jgi:hypothetical protein
MPTLMPRGTDSAMPRPTAAQVAYGSATIVCSTLVMLLLSGTSAGIGIAVIGVAALGLGLLIAVTLPQPQRTGAARVARVRRIAAGSPRVPAPRAQGTPSRAEPRLGQQASLRR